MQLRQNSFKKALARRSRQIGMWCNLNSPIAAEIVGAGGFDWIVIDMEHGIGDVASVVQQLQALSTAAATPIVRVPWNDFVLIKRLLDAGAPGLLVPYVQNREEAEAAARAIRYPPHGIRGVAGHSRATAYGRIADYHHHAHEQIVLIVQVETADALACLEEIASVDGVDGVFIGPSDLAASMGHLANPQEESVQTAVRKAASRLEAVGKAAGTMATDVNTARRYLEWGYSFVAVGTDSGTLAQGLDSISREFTDPA
jgi:2-keto-3-deoxy-L-rhamnonate aldolase RhmA